MKKEKLRNRDSFKISKINYLFLLLVLVGVGYAIIQISYSFIGTANLAAAANVDLYLDNLVVMDGSVNAKSPATIDDTDKLGVSFAIDLNNLDDFYEFEVDIVNNGSDAQVSSINLSGIPNNIKKYFIYTLTYADNRNIKVNDILLSGDKRRIKLLVKFSDTEDLAGIFGVSSGVENLSLNLSFEINYVPVGSGPVTPSEETLIRQLKLEENAISDSSINFGSLNENGLYKLSSSSNIYYYRGNVDNNNVLFAELCWKIVRTTEDGGIKLIYNGLPSNGVCNSTNVSIGSGEYNTTKNNARYVGYMYNDSLNIDSTDESVNSTNSNIKAIIDEWYRNHLTSYTNNLEDAVWCNDRESSNGTVFAGSGTRGLNSSNPSPEVRDSKICSNRMIDKFTVGSGYGNGKLEYPVGLLTADEVLLAGNGVNGGTTYLTSTNPFWTMTPLQFASRASNMFVVYEDGMLDGSTVDEQWDIRPSIVLKENLKVVEGDGRSNYPYFITEPDPEPVKQQSIIQYLGLDGSAINDSGVNFGVAPTNSGLYVKNETTNSEYPIYYYRGDVDNNNVLFANLCWKIVRTTELGGTKLVYNGEPSNGQCNNSGDASQIGVSAFNTTKNNARFVGYMYNTTLNIDSTDVSVNTTNSAIRDTLDTWYGNTMTSYTEKLEDAVWCNDRESSSGTVFAGSEIRDLLGTPSPEIRESRICTRTIDRFTTTYDDGNAKLQYPVGLLTADEVVVAGNGANGGTTYLTSGNPFWTMTPLQFASRSANNFVVYEDGVLDGGAVDDENGVRPSIVLKVGLEVSGGFGTANSPYVIE